MARKVLGRDPFARAKTPGPDETSGDGEVLTAPESPKQKGGAKKANPSAKTTGADRKGKKVPRTGASRKKRSRAKTTRKDARSKPPDLSKAASKPKQRKGGAARPKQSVEPPQSSPSREPVAAKQPAPPPQEDMGMPGIDFGKLGLEAGKDLVTILHGNSFF